MLLYAEIQRFFVGFDFILEALYASAILFQKVLEMMQQKTLYKRIEIAATAGWWWYLERDKGWS